MVDIKTVVKHLANGSLGEKLCLICLNPLDNNYENVFTKICKEGDEFCVADVLEICQMELSETDNYNVCIECFHNASSVLRFHNQVKKSKEIIEFYCEQLLMSINTDVDIPEDPSQAMYISLPFFNVPDFQFNLLGLGYKHKFVTEKDIKPVKINDVDDKVLMIIKEGEILYYKVGADDSLVQLTEDEKEVYSKNFTTSPSKSAPKKARRKMRGPMVYRSCRHCPVKYRFITKLKFHMKNEHNVDLYVCKICKAMTEDKQEYYEHMKTHSNIHQCAICNVVFKRRSTIIAHIKAHQRKDENMENAHICEECGEILENEMQLAEHKHRKHEKKFTCYFCGRLYKGEFSLQRHIKKHEVCMQKNKSEVKEVVEKKTPAQEPNARPRKECSICGKDFVDQRALLWHQRLHTNERPYTCKMCGKGFVSMNRRNQHVLCAHSAPTKGCPLCPALFHLRSMVSSHIKKVHLQAHKRRPKATKYRNVYWSTQPVPIQELSVSIQNEILQIQAQGKTERTGQHVTLINDA